ncbi:MAG: hypothetical protein AAF800_06865 [Planctomycetota bacterium]
MDEPDAVSAAVPVLDTLIELGVPVAVGGSVASSLYGQSRSTLDADLMADLRLGQVARFVTAMEPDYYLSVEAIREALAERTSFNLIHLGSMLKVDVFLPKQDPHDQEVLRRCRSLMLDEAGSIGPYPVASPEDVILKKLDWYLAGHGVSDQQWRDVLSVVRLNREMLDRGYLRGWAERLGTLDLLDQVWSEAET